MLKLSIYHFKIPSLNMIFTHKYLRKTLPGSVLVYTFYMYLYIYIYLYLCNWTCLVPVFVDHLVTPYLIDARKNTANSFYEVCCIQYVV